jgi:histone acetyltransferase (RNA polymerase elongator complex component)
MKHVNIPIFVPHVGCPFTCIFCNQRHIASQQEPLSPSAIPELVEQYLATIPPGSEIEIAFFGGSFTMMDISLQEAYLSQVYPYLQKDVVKGLRLSTRPDGIDPGILELLKKWGVKTIELGVQSCNDEVLALSGRGIRLEQIISASRLIKEYGFKLGIQLMVGLPGDNRHKDLATARITIGMQPDMVRIYPTLVIAGTELARQWQQGSYQELGLAEAISICGQMLLLFQYHCIPVIRLGLQPSQDLQPGQTLLAGPYHPAFGSWSSSIYFISRPMSCCRMPVYCHGRTDRSVSSSTPVTFRG